MLQARVQVLGRIPTLESLGEQRQVLTYGIQAVIANRFKIPSSHIEVIWMPFLAGTQLPDLLVNVSISLDVKDAAKEAVRYSLLDQLHTYLRVALPETMSLFRVVLTPLAWIQATEGAPDAYTNKPVS